MPLSPQDCRLLAAHVSAHGSAEGFVPKYPRKPRKNEEFTMQCALVSWWADYCKTVGVPEFLLWHTPNSAVYGGSKAQREKMGAMLKRLGQRSGVPDLALMVPQRFRIKLVVLYGPEAGKPVDPPLQFNGLFLELKAPKGIVSDEQKAILAALEQQGYATAVCRTLEDAQGVISDYLKP